MIKQGLRPIKRDGTEFDLGALYTLPKLETLPLDFELKKTKIKHQQNSDFCTAFASCSASELQEGVELSPEWSFAVGKMITGEADSWGLGIKDICKAHQKYGAIEAKDSPYNLETKDNDFLRRIENWPSGLFNKALYHKKGAYLEVKGPYDHFDNIRATLYKFRKEQRAVISGVMWQWDLSDKYLNYKTDDGIPHCIHYKGFKTYNGEKYLVMQNSYGKDAGNDGVHYLSREAVNRFVELFGAFVFVDISKEQAENYLKNGSKVDNPLWITLLDYITNLLNTLKKKI